MQEMPRQLAQYRVQRGREIVERQRKLVQYLRKRSIDTHTAEKLLDAYESSLAIFEDDLERIEARPRAIIGATSLKHSATQNSGHT